MRAYGEPTLVHGGLLLDWLDEVFADLPYLIGADELDPGVPPAAMTPRALRNWLLSAGTSYPSRDRAWAGIVAAARRPDPTGRSYRLLALGLALTGLRAFRRRIHIRTVQDLPDVHADLAHGLLQRLSTIDTDRRNIAGRLIGSAIGYAARRYRHHHNRPHPRDLDGHRHQSWVDPRSIEVCLYKSAAALAESGRPLESGDIDLIAATRLDRDSVITAAARLGVPAEAAYKRRQRAEARLANQLARRPTGRDTAA